MTAKPPIIIIKKGGGHGGHHGGAWKVAYADFVTAMMALFIVLWLLNSSKQIQDAVGILQRSHWRVEKSRQRYAGLGPELCGFERQYVGTKRAAAEGDSRGSEHRKTEKPHRYDGGQRGTANRIDGISEWHLFRKWKRAKPNGDGDDILITLAHELGKLPNKIYVEGHTDAKPYSQNSTYTNWELSADRANATRRLIQQNGVGSDQITQVRGFADQSLRKPDAPLDPANRRVSMIVQYLVKKPEEDSKSAAKEGGAEAKPSESQPAKPKH